MGKRYAALVLPLFAVALAACSDDGTSPEESGLTSAEATALAEALDELGIVAVDAGVSGQSGPNLMLLPNEGISSAEVVGEDQFNYGISCPRGGSAAVEGQYQISVDEEAQSATIDVAAVQSHTDCGMRVSGTNDLFVDGSLQFVAQRVAADERLTSTQSHAGTLNFETSEGNDGRCDIILSSELTLEGGMVTRVLTGNVCGHNVNAEGSWAVE